MTYCFRSLILICALRALASAQSASAYTNTSADETTVYSTGVLQYDGADCGTCGSASHTYQQTVQITSPSGRTAGCTNGPLGAPGTTPVSMQCPAQIPISQDYGDYTVEYDPYAFCSVAGIFLSDRIFIYIAHGLTYSQSVPWPSNGPDCPQQPACTPGTTARCPLAVVHTCTDCVCFHYYRTDWLVVNGTCVGILGPNNTLATGADGPGPCQ